MGFIPFSSFSIRTVPFLCLMVFMSAMRIRYSFGWTSISRLSKPGRSQMLHSSVVCHLNRFLFNPAEIDHVSSNSSTSGSSTSTIIPTVTLPKDDYRTVHAAKILNLQNGDTVRAGLVSCSKDGEEDGFLTDEAIIEWLPEGKVKKAEPLRNGNPPGSIRFILNSLEIPSQSTGMTKPTVSLILALPRPLQLGRMLPMISQMGVNHLILTEARKVPKDYFGSHLFRKPHLLEERLIEGLCQAGDVRLPKVHIVRHLSNFLNDELDALFPKNEYARVIAHPQRPNSPPCSVKRMLEVEFPAAGEGDASARKMVIAVGPEGGWKEPEELDRFVDQYGFQQITMGKRVLRSDCAVVSLLSLAHEACCSE